MAIMHPSSIIESQHVKSEVKFYKACRDQLPDSKYHVFYSVRWYTVTNGVREDSECDFLIFNPDYGFICVEVKGGSSIGVDGTSWYIKDHPNSPPRPLEKSPYYQAEQSMQFFKQYYEEEMEASYPGIYGCAVAFPNYNIDTPITPSSPLELTIDLNDMSNLLTKITEIFRYYRGKRIGRASFLSPASQRKFISIVNRRIALSIAAGALIEDKQSEFEELNRTQDTIIDLLTHYPRAFVVGGAGTGKTWIGIKKVKRCILNGGKALFLCYNKALANMVKKQFHDSADCNNFDSFIWRILGNEAHSVPTNNGIREYSAVLCQKTNIPQYDLVIVDEAQDFSEDWAYCVNLFLKPNGSLYVFYDEGQNIFQRSFGEKFYIDFPPFVLRYNIRNTSNIYRYAQEQSGLGLDTISNRIEGVEPDYHCFNRIPKAVSFMDSIIHKLVSREGVSSSKIVILSNRTKSNSILDNTESVGECLLSENGENSNGIAFYTIQSFKGLESDVVIYLNHTYKNEPLTEAKRALLYTAYTRARFYLYVIDFEQGNE